MLVVGSKHLRVDIEFDALEALLALVSRSRFFTPSVWDFVVGHRRQNYDSDVSTRTSRTTVDRMEPKLGERAQGRSDSEDERRRRAMAESQVAFYICNAVSACRAV